MFTNIQCNSKHYKQIIINGDNFFYGDAVNFSEKKKVF